MKQRVILIASVAVGLIAAVLTRQYLNAKDREVARKLQQLTQAYRKISVVVVNRNVSVGTILAREDLGVLDVIESAVRSHVVGEQDFTMLINRKLIRPLEKGAPICWSDIEGGDPRSGGGSSG